MTIEWSEYIETVAKKLLGEPNKSLSTPTQLRYGSHGSLSIELAGEHRGTWYDHESERGGGTVDLLIRSGIKSPVAWMRAQGLANGGSDDPPPQRRIVATYDYRDEADELLLQVVRFEPRDFRQRRPGSNGSWEWSVKGVRHVPYRLSDILAHPESSVIVVEGEKDADRLALAGFVATCNAGGAGKWKEELNPFFAGRRVFILPDNDAAGAKHAHAVGVALTPVATQVTIVDLPGLPDKGDVSDWLDNGGSPSELRRLCREAIAAPPKAKAEVKGSGNLSRYSEQLSERYPELRFNLLNGAVDGEVDPSEARLFLEMVNDGKTPKKDLVFDAIVIAARNRSYDPLIEHINALPAWDGTPRVEKWLINYGNAADNEYNKTIGQKWLISAIARAMLPSGSKVDTLLALLGSGGTQKSTAFEVLGGDFYKSNLNVSDLHGKESRQELRGSWIIELPELTTLRRSDINATKGFLSEIVDKYRPSYGRGVISVPRRCVFGGTVNPNQPFLHDNETQRRFWICKVGRFDIEALARDRDQLLAEAKQLFHDGEKWHVDFDADSVFQQQTEALQEECRSGDAPWREDIAKHLEKYMDQGGEHAPPVCTVSKCLEDILVPVAMRERSAQMKMAAALRSLGWTKGGRVTDERGTQVVQWLPPVQK